MKNVLRDCFFDGVMECDQPQTCAECQKVEASWFELSKEVAVLVA